MPEHLSSPQADGDSGARTIQDRVAEEIAAALDLDLAEVRPGCRLVDDFGSTALDLATLRWSLEHAFGVSIPAAAIDRWREVADVTSYIEGRTAADRITG